MSLGKWAAAVVLAVLWPMGVMGQTTAPAEAPAGDQLGIVTHAAGSGYGQEAYRIVSRDDEVISVLKNGLTVICKRVPTSVVSVNGYVFTGGVYEGEWLGGGLSHLLEHLVAGGSSQRRNEDQNEQLVEKIGNNTDASTDYDYTTFYVDTTAPHLEDAVDLVTGWMLGARFTQAEFDREHEVVQRELERNKGNPDRVFWQMIQENRYQVSPRRVPVIGYQEVIQGLTRDDVFSYYQMAYQPNNMVFSIAGDVDPETMLAAVSRFVDDAKPGRAFSRDIAPEPPVVSPRTLVGTFPKLSEAKVDLAFPSVKISDDDMYPLDLLATVLGSGESAMLVQDVRDKKLCSDVETGDETPAYVEGSFSIDLSLDADQIAAATKAVLADIEKVKADGVDADRLDRAKVQMRLGRLRSMQKSEDVADSMARDFMMTGDAHFSDRYVDRIAAVTAEQVRAAARKYLDQGKLLTTVLLPADAPGSASLAKAEDLVRAAIPGGQSATTQPAATAEASQRGAAPTDRTVLDNGLVVLHKRVSTTPLVQVSMFALGGMTAEDASNNGIGSVTMKMLRRGTMSRSAGDIAEFFDRTGGEISTECGRNTWYWTTSCLVSDLSKTMDVYADLVNNPSFAPAELDSMRPRLDAGIDALDDQWDGQAFRYFDRQFFGPMNSPYQFDALGKRANVDKLTGQDLKAWYSEKILTAPRVIAIFGDIDKDTAIALAKEHFGGGKLSSVPPLNIGPAQTVAPAETPTITIDRVEVNKTDKDVAGVVIGFESGSQLGEPDEPILQMAWGLTGGYGSGTGYIFTILRGEGLVYEASSFNSPGRSADLRGSFNAYAGCDPKNVDRVVDTILQSIARIQGTPADIDTDWFGRCKNLVTTLEAMQNETPADQAEQAALDELLGLGYDYHDGFAKRIDGVTLAQVQQVARTWLRKCVVTVSTPDPAAVTLKPGDRVYATFPPVNMIPPGIEHDVPQR